MAGAMACPRPPTWGGGRGQAIAPAIFGLTQEDFVDAPISRPNTM
ncbi:hypothetical protein [Reticulibacter mediterranei]|nr:hypothetical protein [Reticulibacter mediterranei]